MAKKKRTELTADERLLSRLVINKAFTGSLYLLCAVIFVFLASTIFAELVQNHPWGVIALSSIIICSILAIYPETEQWTYEPWQKEALKIERHQDVYVPDDGRWWDP